MTRLWSALLIAVGACSGHGTRGLEPPPACAPDALLLEHAAQQSAAGYLGRALIAAEAAVHACPSPAALRALGVVLTDLGLRERAIAAYERAGDRSGAARARALPPERSDPSPEQQAEARLYYRQAFDLRLQGQHDRAIGMFRASYQRWPHPLTIVQIGLAHRAAGRTVEYRKANARALALAESTRDESARAVPRRGHTAGVAALAFHPSQPLLASGGDEGQAILWDLRSGRMVTALEGHQNRVKALAFSPDGSSLVTGSADGTARVWDVASGESLRVFAAHGRPVLAAAFSPDGTVVASASTQPMLWNPATGELIAIPPGRGDRAIAFSPDGARLIAAAGSDLRMWETATGQEVRVTRAHDRVLTAAFSPDGTRIATAGTDHLVRLWDAAGGAEVATLRGHREAVRAVAFAPDGATLVSAGRDRVAIVWDVANGTERARLAHGDALLAVAVSPDGARIATGSQDGVITEWDAVSGSRMRELRGGGSPILALDLSGDGRHLATGSVDGTVKTWDLARPREMRVLRAARDWGNDVRFNANGARLAVASGMGPSTVQVWDVAHASVLRTIDRDRPTRSIALSPDGGTVVVPGETTELWDVDGGERTRSLDNPRYVIGGVVAMNPGGTALALSGAARIRWWDLPAAGTARDVHEPDGQMLWSLAWSDDGGLLAGGNDEGVVHVWDARSGEARGSYPDQLKQVWSLQFSADGRRLASGGDTDVVIRELGRDSAPLAIRAHRDRVEAIRFARGGELVLTASRDETIAVHDARTGALRATLFATATDGFVVIDAAGRIDGDAGADSLIDWHVGDIILPGYIGWQRNHHADLLREIL